MANSLSSATDFANSDERTNPLGTTDDSWSNSLHSNRQTVSHTVDVVVIGAGFSGLQAAYDSHKAGLSVLTLEARDRIAGRSFSSPRTDGEGILELGATWINQTTQPKVYELTRRYNLETAEHVPAD